jgi:hypothetical protein
MSNNNSNLLKGIVLGTALTIGAIYLKNKMNENNKEVDDEDIIEEETQPSHREHYMSYEQIPIKADSQFSYTTPASSSPSIVTQGASNLGPPTPEQLASVVSNTSIQPITTQLYNQTKQKIDLPKPELPPPTFPLGDNADPAQNVIYDRQITARLKPVYRNTPDYIRGDLAIPVLRRGYFDVGISPQLQLNQGALLQMGDISSAMQLQDLMYERNMHYDSFENRELLKAPYDTQYARRSP